MRQFHWIIALAAIGAYGVLNAGDKDSVVDYFKSTSRPSSFSARAQAFRKLHPNTSYVGNSDQNRELLGVYKVSDALGTPLDGLTRPTSEFKALSTQVDYTEEFSGWKPRDCRPISRPSSNPLMRKIDSIASTRGESCGLGNDASHFGPHCDPFLQPQDRACAIHDRALKKCNSSWDDWNNLCVMDAHRELAATSVDPLIANTFDALSNLPMYPKFAPRGNKLDDGRLVPNGFDFHQQVRPKGFSTPVFPTGFEW